MSKRRSARNKAKKESKEESLRKNLDVSPEQDAPPVTPGDDDGIREDKEDKPDLSQLLLAKIEQEAALMKSLGLNPEEPVFRVFPELLLNSTNTHTPVDPIKVDSIQHPLQTDLQIQHGSNVKFKDGTFMRVESIETENKSAILVGRVMFPVGQIGPDLPLVRHNTVWVKSDHARISDPVFYPYTRSSSLVAQELAWLVRDLLPGEQNVYGLDDDKWRRVSIDLAEDTPQIIFTNELDDTTLKDLISTESLFCRMKKREGIVEGTALITSTMHTCLSRRLSLVDVEFLQPHEADEGYKVAASRIRRWSRAVDDAVKLKGVSTTTNSGCAAYTAIDGFCGAGGVSQGMKDAGVNVVIAFDQDKQAIETYHSNMPQTTEAYCQEANHWIEAARKEVHRPAFLHLSCPCQPFSVAHRTPGQNDVVNRDCLLTISPLIDSVRPRILTLEQAWGILEDVRELWLIALKAQLVENRYSFQMKIVDMRDHGVAQARQRLVVIGSAPGEVLPCFPKPSTPSGQWRSIEDVFTPLYAAIKEGRPFPKHNPKGGLRAKKDSYVTDKSRHVTTIMTKQYQWPAHWSRGGMSGRRALTIEEGKLAQGFDLEFALPTVFSNEVLSRQIGNAVPPPFAKDLFQHLVAHLDKTDTMDLPSTPTKPLTAVNSEVDKAARPGGEGSALDGVSEEPSNTEDEFEGFDDKPSTIGEHPQHFRKRPWDTIKESKIQDCDSEVETPKVDGRFDDTDGESSGAEQRVSRKKPRRESEVQTAEEWNEFEDDVIRTPPPKNEDKGVVKLTNKFGKLASPGK